MADVLGQIVARKRIEVAERLGGKAVAAEPTRRSLRAALSRPGARFVMEVKRASPSGHRSDVSVERAAAAYAPIADAISVLIDGPGFGGSLDDLRAVRPIFDGPILAKEFIVDPAQVNHGADLCNLVGRMDVGQHRHFQFPLHLGQMRLTMAAAASGSRSCTRSCTRLTVASRSPMQMDSP